MATLSSLLSSRSILSEQGEETNLEQGRIWGYSPQNHSNFQDSAKWFGCQVTASDSEVFTIQVEMWGAGGRGNACLCCCGSGVGGNPGAYIRFNTPMTRYGYICITGMRACQSGSNCMCGGAGDSTCARICPGCVAGVNTYTCTCACAQAGCGGRSMCMNGGAIMCCLGQNGACITPNVSYDGSAVGNGCGMVCNIGSGNNWPTADTLSKAYYSDPSGSQMGTPVCCNTDPNRVACMFFGHCNPCCWNHHRQIIHTAPMRYSTCGGEMMLGHTYADYLSYHGTAFGNMDAAVHGLSRSPTRGARTTSCWSGYKMCECYENTGCLPYWPVTQPAPATMTCSGVRTHGFTGGHGAIRIRYTGTISV